MAVLACAASASFGSFYMAEAPGMGLARRDTIGYQCNPKVCTLPGNTCAEVCGADYDQCSSNKANETHCFRPAAGESCCMDGSGNSCQKGFFCTNDPDKNNWCCPDGMGLEDCAAKFGVKGRLQLAKPSSTSTTAAPPSTSSSSSPPPASSTPATTTSTTSLVTSQADSTTYAAQKSADFSTGAVRVLVNSTAANVGPTQPAYVPSRVPPPSNITVSGAATSGVSSLLLVLAGVVAVM
ncbi:hypothetical protein HRG_003791 [Hirsutella rhossiliensis]|uniref:Prp 4 CRoW domain-containing protein n=1 Tax=Hirsutella rhossiliensis TaxID=111463 RepID=A0A9P8N2N7_9HYPO|nr:uncharacterized protein HRG_03791 [Hirsutella rhossiliensis]KAH0965775.1 hypothetical protein HRG_03791 [Hirsutella rhossiliensis]